MNITILACEGKETTGLVTYSRNVTKELLKMNDRIKMIPISSLEFKVGERLVGGYIFSGLKFAKIFAKKIDGDIVHSLDLQVIHPKTNIVTLHDLTALYRSKLEKYLYKFLLTRLGHMKKIITPTNYIADNVAKITGVNREKFITVYYGLNHKMFYPSNKTPEEIAQDKYNLVHVGEVRERKNIHLILEAITALGEGYRFIHIGPDRELNYKEKCLEIARKNDIDFINIGYLSQEKIKDYYTHADLFVFPSKDEGFGLPPLEAMACGTTSVVSNIPVFREIYKNSVYYSELNPNELADKIEYAVKHKKPKNELISYAKKFTWEKAAENLLKIYEEASEK
ncbi:MAG: glycosyltransferase family 4 protein [Thermoplasmatales archaeon]|nr:glycosyltransferase family 4 protein [Thermoplasmatales archaeon]